MITEKDNVFYCDCGFSFERGRSGAHTCETGLRKKLAESEAKLAALAAENAGLKAAKKIIRHLNANREEANFCGIDDCHIDDAVAAMITPATDAYLAEVRAQGVEMFADSLKVLDCHEHPYSTVAKEFTAQLRHGVKL
ncbi:TPA: hypothetical protein U2L64_000046 [Citrobacter koseri]|uniref:Uncharacterized protein n=1 Tax=Citrobacter koseri (strain ATCC BAA-895 / CDC 4225-83 / SGSC4696) TaxID=290338 RepID=A8AHR1_CITK8|nr:hypothetical protein [Citrobacter koseri]ABV13025.1 hypothetical protein CKO_01898 [Citrobacter koseri ATCC BAA-895]EJD6489845.1 hypothetical protein [Citrobacter koseri]EKU0538956.1 hypothetical protein [Citrobacter koseri]EKU8893361.1 hypothetical protein [Citrobacter koseri]EKW1002875.1 hypothetical protein [Citrobacter koseri]